MIREIIQAPDARLLMVSREVEVFGSDERRLVGDMLDTMRKHRAFGLAAVQVGVPLRIVTVNPATGFAFNALINPVVVSIGRDLMDSTEGCLSIEAGQRKFKLKRWSKIFVRFQDRGDVLHTIVATGNAAAVLQHEIDHLNGIMVDRKAERC